MKRREFIMLLGGAAAWPLAELFGYLSRDPKEVCYYSARKHCACSEGRKLVDPAIQQAIVPMRQRLAGALTPRRKL